MTLIYILNVTLKNQDIQLKFLLKIWIPLKRNSQTFIKFLLKDFVLNQILFCIPLFSILRIPVLLDKSLLFFKTVFNFLLQKTNFDSDEWHADETYIKINGIKHYLWILLDSETRVVIAFHLSAAKDSYSSCIIWKVSPSLSYLTPVSVAGVKYFQKQAKHWFLFFKIFPDCCLLFLWSFLFLFSY